MPKLTVLLAASLSSAALGLSAQLSTAIDGDRASAPAVCPTGRRPADDLIRVKYIPWLTLRDLKQSLQEGNVDVAAAAPAGFQGFLVDRVKATMTEDGAVFLAIDTCAGTATFLEADSDFPTPLGWALADVLRALELCENVRRALLVERVSRATADDRTVTMTERVAALTTIFGQTLLSNHHKDRVALNFMQSLNPAERGALLRSRTADPELRQTIEHIRRLESVRAPQLGDPNRWRDEIERFNRDHPEVREQLQRMREPQPDLHDPDMRERLRRIRELQRRAPPVR